MNFKHFLFLFFFGMNKLSKRFRGVNPIVSSSNSNETMRIIIYRSSARRVRKKKKKKEKKLAKCFHEDMQLMG